MSKKILARGLALIQYAILAADGTPDDVWRDLGYTDRDSDVTLVEGDPTQDPVYSHELDPALDIEYTMGDKPIVFSLITPTMEQRAILLGGTVTGTGDDAVLTLPSVKTPLEVSLRVLPKKGEIYTAGRVQLWAKENKNWAKSSKWAYDVVGNVLAPINDAIAFEKEGPQVSTLRGGVDTGSIEAAGADYDDGTFTNVPLVSGAGEGAKATIVVGVGGNVTTVTKTAAGSGYHEGSILTAPSLAGGSGFEWKLTGVV